MIAGYVRVSTQKQADDGVSIEMQQQMIIRHAIMLDMIENEDEIKFYIDDGFSGSTLERPQMKNLIKDIKEKKVTILMAYDLSRVSRDMFDSNTFLNMLTKHNVITKFLYDDINLTTATSRFGTNIKILTNQYEREKVVERTNDSLQSIAESGRYPCGGRPPFGYYRGTDKNIYIDEEKSKIIRKIFDMAARGYDKSDIVRYVKESTEEIKAKTNNITRLVRDTKYKGIFEYKGKIYDEMIPAIIDIETFDKANFNFRKWKSRKDGNYIFDGMIVCSKCNSVMRCSHGLNHQGRKYYYYLCGNCKKQVSQIKLEKQFVELDKNTNSIKIYRDKLMSRRRNLRTKIDNVNEEYQLDLMSNDEYYRLAVILDKQLDDLDSKIESLGNYKYEVWWTLKQKVEYVRTRVNYILFELTKKEIKNIKYIEYSDIDE